MAAGAGRGHAHDDGHEVETGAADPVAERAAIEMDALPLEGLGLAIERKVIAEFRDDDPGDEEFRGQPAGHDMFGGTHRAVPLRPRPGQGGIVAWVNLVQ